MTIATFSRRGQTFSVSILGHAGYGAGGPDIVCAACSILSYTLLQCVLSLEDEGALKELQTEEIDGNITIGLTSYAWAKEKTETVSSVIEAGFALLAQKYPEHVKIINDGEK
jgi:uncharacterized protein YsxB (DUF464 family)